MANNTHSAVFWRSGFTNEYFVETCLKVDVLNHWRAVEHSTKKVKACPALDIIN